MRDRWFTDLLLATTVGTYALAALGASTAATDAAGPVALLHHVLAVVVGAALAVVLLAAWTEACRPGVRAAVTIAAAAYPVQAGMGLALLVGEPFGWIHLAVGTGIFATLLVGLVWRLDAADLTAVSGRSEPGRPADPDPEPVRTSDAGRCRTGVAATVSAYIALTKPRLMWLLCLLALGGIGLASAAGATIDGVTVVATLGGGVLAVGASGTFNHLYERDRDRRMARTADRPLATDRVSPVGAAVYGVGLAVGSLATMLAFANGLAAALTLAAIVYYSVVYTVLLKPNSTWSIAIGGGAGALPAVIGWAAVTGSVGAPALLLAAVVVFWTPGHFYNLGIAYRDDYARGEYPIVPVVRGVPSARRRIGYAFGATFVAAAVLGAVAGLGALYTGVVVAGAAGLLLCLASQCRTGTVASTMRSFHATNAFLGGLLVAILVETILL